MDVLRFKQANCKNCYKCVRFCPVKSIRVYQGHAQIISSDCILCGNCVSVCPQHAKEDISDVAQIQELIASGQQVVVSVDSSYIAYFDKDGRGHKAFLLPQEDPEQNLRLTKSYNVPELTRDAVRTTAKQLKECIYRDEDTQKVKYVK